MRATFICVTYNSNAHFPGVYDSCKAAVSGETEFIAVDNASPNGVERLEADRLLIQSENLRFTPATNVGLKAAQPSDFYVIVNPDVRLEPRSLDKLFDEMAQMGAAIAGAVLVYPNLKVQHGGGMDYPELSDDELLHRKRKAHKHSGKPLTRALLAQYPCYSRWVTGALLVVSGDAFNRMGPLEEHWRHYHSDLEYCLRASKQGMAVITSSVVGLHMHKASTKMTPESTKEAERQWNEGMDKFRSAQPSADFVTSFNTRIFHDPAQLIYGSFRDVYPTTPLHVYHENSYDQARMDQSIDFGSVPPNYVLHDVFEEQPWLKDFLRTSKLATWRKQRKYWNRNAIFWFRKVASIQACLTHVKSDYLVWMDADCGLKEPLPSSIFKHAGDKDVCCVLRHESHMRGIIDSGIVIFNLAQRGRRVIADWMDWYRSGRAFDEGRWDDGFILTRLLQASEYNVGGLTRDFGSPVDVWQSVRHLKRPLRRVRDKEHASSRAIVMKMCERIEERYVQT